MFLDLKHLLGGFCYRFWSKSMPKFTRKEDCDLSQLGEADRRNLLRTVGAIERHINLVGIAMGILQYLALTQAATIWNSYQGWFSSYSSEIPSVRVVQSVLRAEFFSTTKKVPVCRTLRRILAKARSTLARLAA